MILQQLPTVGGVGERYAESNFLHTSKASFAVWDDCFGSENPTSNGGAYVVGWKYAILHIQY